MVTSEANEACNGAKKKTITEEHVLAALRKLDFGRFASECAGIGGEEQASRRRPSCAPPRVPYAKDRAAAPLFAPVSHSSTSSTRACPPQGGARGCGKAVGWFPREQ